MGKDFNFCKLLDEAMAGGQFPGTFARVAPESNNCTAADTTVEDVLATVAKYRERYAPETQPTDLVLSPSVWSVLRYDEGVIGGPVNYPAAFAGLPVWIA